MPAANRRTCQYPGCNLGEGGEAYTTIEGLPTQELVLKDLELHISMAHTVPGAARGGPGAGQNAGSDIKPDKFPRPEISDHATDTDWQYFLSSWELY